MIGRVLKKFGWQNKIDLSSEGLDDLKIVGFLFSMFIIFIFGFIFPWAYGVMKIFLMIFK